MRIGRVLVVVMSAKCAAEAASYLNVSVCTVRRAAQKCLKQTRLDVVVTSTFMLSLAVRLEVTNILHIAAAM